MKLYLHFYKGNDQKFETFIYHLDDQELITIEDFEKKVFLGLRKQPKFSSIQIFTKDGFFFVIFNGFIWF